MGLLAQPPGRAEPTTIGLLAQSPAAAGSEPTTIGLLEQSPGRAAGTFAAMHLIMIFSAICRQPGVRDAAAAAAMDIAR